MSFLTAYQLQELLSFASIADEETRKDLSQGYIRNENDYTSNFTGTLRKLINYNSQSGLAAKSYLLSPKHEQTIGADAAIVLSRGGESKVAVFESKWPRFSIPGYPWDKEQKSSGISHFSDQLQRQRSWSDKFAVFEMFYCEFPIGEEPMFLRGEGSSCIWKEDAEKFRSERRNPDIAWTQQELRRLLEAKRVPLAEILNEFGLCKRGKPIPSGDIFEVDRTHLIPQRALEIHASGRRACPRK